MANTRKQSTKQSTQPAKVAEVMVCVEKGNDGALRNINALAAPVITVAELTASTSVMEGLCLNLMAGSVDKSIAEAHAKRGGLRRLFPKFANADINALKVCMDCKPETLVAAWQKHAETVKRIRGLSLQAIAKATKEPKQSGDKITLRDAMLAWCADATNEKIMNSKAFPQSLVDIFIQYDLLPETDGEEDAE